MGLYCEDRTWSDRFIPAIKAIVGPYLLVPSPLEVDVHEAADLVVLTGRAMTIACRVRRPGFAERYRQQFTLRAQRDSGTRTELDKIIDGWGDWLFYGHVTLDEQSISPWMIVDLRSFRAHLIRKDSRQRIKYGKIHNGDGTYFAWFDATSFPPDPPLLIAASWFTDKAKREGGNNHEEDN